MMTNGRNALDLAAVTNDTGVSGFAVPILGVVMMARQGSSPQNAHSYPVQSQGNVDRHTGSYWYMFSFRRQPCEENNDMAKFRTILKWLVLRTAYVIWVRFML